MRRPRPFRASLKSSEVAMAGASLPAEASAMILYCSRLQTLIHVDRLTCTMRIRLLSRAVALTPALVLVASLLVPSTPAFAREPNLRVVATVAPLADFVREIAGDRVDLVQMIPDGTDSHTFEPRPSDASFLQAADLVILNGLHLETPTQRMADANKKPEPPYLLLGDNTISPPEYLFDYSFPVPKVVPIPHLWLNVAYAKNYAQLST